MSIFSYFSSSRYPEEQPSARKPVTLFLNDSVVPGPETFTVKTRVILPVLPSSLDAEVPEFEERIKASIFTIIPSDGLPAMMQTLNIAIQNLKISVSEGELKQDRESLHGAYDDQNKMNKEIVQLRNQLMMHSAELAKLEGSPSCSKAVVKKCPCLRSKRIVPIDVTQLENEIAQLRQNIALREKKNDATAKTIDALNASVKYNEAIKETIQVANDVLDCVGKLHAAKKVEKSDRSFLKGEIAKWMRSLSESQLTFRQYDVESMLLESSPLIDLVDTVAEQINLLGTMLENKK